VRHSNATLISIVLKETGKATTLTGTNHGGGLAANANAAAHGLGLRIIRERIDALNGTCELQSAKSLGTGITVTLPQEYARD
jgi:signal transduction histidine kinase